MTTTSPLKSSTSLPPDFYGDATDTDYAEKYKNAKEAEQKLMQQLNDRQDQNSMSMLSLAGEMFDPGRTGSFGEAIGRGAKAYATTRLAENKDLRENAMMRSQLANAQLDSAEALKTANMARPMIANLLGGKLGGNTPPVNVAAAPRQTDPKAEDYVSSEQGDGQLMVSPEDSKGFAANLKAPALTAPPPPGQTPPVQSASTLTPPTINIGGVDVNPQVIAGLRMIPKYRPQADALQYAYDGVLKEREFRQNNIKLQPGFVADVNDPNNPIITPVVAPGQADVAIRFPEFGGKQFMGSVEDQIAVRKAREKGDYDGINKIYDRLQYGVRPTTQSGTQLPARDVTSEAIEKERSNVIAKESAKSEVEETQSLLKNSDAAHDTQVIAQRIMKNVSESPQLFGGLKKPGLGQALASFIRDRSTSNETLSITKENLQEALVKANVNTKDIDLAKMSQVASDLARLHFNFRKLELKGQGQTSDREDAGVAKINGSIQDSPKYLIGMAQIVGRRAQYEAEVIQGLRQYRKVSGNRDATLEEFKSNDQGAYNKVLSRYDSWLDKTFNLGFGQRSSPVPPTANNANRGPITVDSIRAAREAKQARGDKQ